MPASPKWDTCPANFVLEISPMSSGLLLRQSQTVVLTLNGNNACLCPSNTIPKTRPRHQPNNILYTALLGQSCPLPTVLATNQFREASSSQTHTHRPIRTMIPIVASLQSDS